MRTTLNIDDAVIKQLSLAAAEKGQTPSKIAEDAIRAYLDALQATQTKPITIPVSRHDLGLRPGVNLDSSASIAAATDEEDYGTHSQTVR